MESSKGKIGPRTVSYNVCHTPPFFLNASVITGSFVVIPDYAKMLCVPSIIYSLGAGYLNTGTRWVVRGPTVAEAKETHERVQKCFV